MCGSMEGAILLASITRQPSADVVGQHPPMLFSNAIPRRPCVREPLGTLTRSVHRWLPSTRQGQRGQQSCVFRWPR